MLAGAGRVVVLATVSISVTDLTPQLDSVFNHVALWQDVVKDCCLLSCVMSMIKKIMKSAV